MFIVRLFIGAFLLIVCALSCITTNVSSISISVSFVFSFFGHFKVQFEYFLYIISITYSFFCFLLKCCWHCCKILNIDEKIQHSDVQLQYVKLCLLRF